MNEHDIAEQAYKNGYEDGKRDAVKHGRWIGGYMGLTYIVPKCSQCGYGNGAVGAANYCPNCGAKMDGDGQ